MSGDEALNSFRKAGPADSILREALMVPGCELIRHVILEFDFRRRGLRMDCVLLAEGVLFVIEFKRSQLERADRDQVMNYAVNLLEFHRITREWCEENDAIVVPVLALTEARAQAPVGWSGLSGHSWPALARKPLECDRDTLAGALLLGLQNRRSDASVSGIGWLDSPFRPSSSILDATLSLYGNHDVAAINDHAAPKEAIDAIPRKSGRTSRWRLPVGLTTLFFFQVPRVPARPLSVSTLSCAAATQMGQSLSLATRR